MASPDCYAVLDVCFARFSQLSIAGAPQTGAGNGYVSDNAQKVTVGLTVKKGAEFTVTNGCGAIKADIIQPDTITGATVTIDLGLMEHDLLGLLCGGTVFDTLDHAHSIGWQVPKIADTAPFPVSMEFWSKAIDGSAPAVTAASTPNAAYEVTVLPYVICTFMPFTLANGMTVYQVTGVGSENSALTANGAWNDWPAGVAGHGGITSVTGFYQTATLPSVSCGLQAVPTGS